MDENDNKIDETLDRIVRLQEEGKHLTDEEIAQLLQDGDDMRSFKYLQNCKNAVMRHCSPQPLDLDAQWNQLKQKKDKEDKAKPALKSNLFIWGAFTGIAASVLIAFVFVWLHGNFSNSKGYVAFHAVDSLQQVMLQASSGSIPLSSQTNAQALTAVGTSLLKDDTLQLAYSSQKSVKVETHILTIPRGKDFKIVLADGTEVWLNTDSRLIYPTRFTGRERHVQLQGEAYFKVAHDAEHPFIITTGNMQARVLGTELNIRSYTSNDSHVTLINGRVEVHGGGSKGQTVVLSPGEDAQWHDGGALSVHETDVDSYVYWKDGYFYFDDKPLVEIMQSLGRWYNINVVFDDKDLMGLRMRYFCVRSESLERAISLLNRMKKIQATISGNTIYIR
jgi:Fe2+-dicitrate sensor, membrane component